MITNERQYQTTKAAAQELEAALAQADEDLAQLDPEVRQAIRDNITGELQALSAQLQEYDAYRSGSLATWQLRAFDELPDALIRARLARGWTQTALAERLGLKQQQIQHYEATRYSSASLARIADIVRALNVDLAMQIELIDNGPSAELERQQLTQAS